MRSPLIVLAVSLTNVCAQNQERTLIDRLLRPNMELKNPQQGKAFRADSKFVAHSANVKSFIVNAPVREKAFADVRTAATKKYHSSSIQSGAEQKSFGDARQAGAPAQVTMSSVRDVHPANDANLRVADRKFANARSFRDQGKSQKSLGRQNPPLTIDQVRELLNKNK